MLALFYCGIHPTVKMVTSRGHDAHLVENRWEHVGLCPTPFFTLPGASGRSQVNDSGDGAARIDAQAEWLGAVGIVAAFHGTVVGAIGCFAAALSSDGVLTHVAGAGAGLCATLWAYRLNCESESWQSVGPAKDCCASPRLRRRKSPDDRRSRHAGEQREYVRTLNALRNAMRPMNLRVSWPAALR
jgi:hypothetical protein